MTTIAYKDGIMASDTQATAGTMIVNDRIGKIYLIDNVLYGFSGSLSSIRRVISWLENGKVGKDVLKEMEEDSCYYIEVKPNCYPRVCYVYKDGFELIEDRGKCVAIGSGSEYALGAMEAGASAMEAVKIACKYDVYSGGDVEVKYV